MDNLTLHTFLAYTLHGAGHREKTRVRVLPTLVEATLRRLGNTTFAALSLKSRMGSPALCTFLAYTLHGAGHGEKTRVRVLPTLVEANLLKSRMGSLALRILAFTLHGAGHREKTRVRVLPTLVEATLRRLDNTTFAALSLKSRMGSLALRTFLAYTLHGAGHGEKTRVRVLPTLVEANLRRLGNTTFAGLSLKSRMGSLASRTFLAYTLHGARHGEKTRVRVVSTFVETDLQMLGNTRITAYSLQFLMTTLPLRICLAST